MIECDVVYTWRSFEARRRGVPVIILPIKYSEAAMKHRTWRDTLTREREEVMRWTPRNEDIFIDGTLTQLSPVAQNEVVKK